MPRERITHRREVLLDDATTSDVPVHSDSLPQPGIHVCWYPQGDGGGWVQLMTEVDTRWLEKLLKDHNPADGFTIELFTEVLSREECNKMIRVMRRARDRSYGKDE